MVAEERPRFLEPAGEEQVGRKLFKRLPTAYEKFMAEQDIPIFHGIGIYDVRQLPMGPWRRMGGKGSFIELSGLSGIKGMYAVEMPGGAALNPEHHLYEEFIYVVEGRGATEVWRTSSSKRHMFEWEAGALFTIPINTEHRLLNGSSSPAIILAATNAPPIMNIFQSEKFVFQNPYQFHERYDENEDYFKSHGEIEAEPMRGRATVVSNVFPDIIHCFLPLDNRRVAGYRRIQPRFFGFEHNADSGGFIGEFPSGRYAKAHHHSSGPVLVCLTGKGYTYAWPRDLGARPWEAGKGHLVKRQDYIPGGLVSAAPGGGDWYHQHFAVAREPLRVLNFWGGPIPLNRYEDKDAGVEIKDGTNAIEFKDEDPSVAAEYRAAVEREGVPFQMREDMYRI